MKTLTKPWWILITTTLPLLILFGLFANSFSLVESQLGENQREMWVLHGWRLMILTAVSLLFSVFLWWRKKSVNALYAFLVLVAIPLFLFLVGDSGRFYSWGIPDWMRVGEPLLYACAFSMPGCLHAIVILVVRFTPNETERKAWKSFVFATSVPLVWFAIVTIARAFRIHNPVNQHKELLIFLIVASCIFFLFLLGRALYILASKHGSNLGRFAIIWKLLITIIFPLWGLLLNNGVWSFHSEKFFFGNFTHWIFYALVVVNGILLCLPSAQSRKYMLVLFALRWVFFIFTLYFFMLFVPFLPLSVALIIFEGIGLLMLSPIAMFFIHIATLNSDFKFLADHYSRKMLVTTAVLCFLVIPLFVTITFVRCRSNLDDALSFVYHPDYENENDVDESKLSYTLDQIATNKKVHRHSAYESALPFISSYFNWIVLDNMTLQNTKIARLQKIFTGKNDFDIYQDLTESTPDSKTEATTTSRFDEKTNRWTSEVTFTVSRTSTWNSEYSQSFDLPAGCYISDCYLMMGNRKEKGILAERHAATFVYHEIVTRSQDPLLIRYAGGNRINMRVFPVNDSGRVAGIEFIHKEPLQLSIADTLLQLGDSLMARQQHILPPDANETVKYVSATEKSALPTIQRTPYFCFMFDMSVANDSLKEAYIKMTGQLLSRNQAPCANAKFFFVNSKVTTCQDAANWKEELKHAKSGGGYFLERAIMKELIQNHHARSSRYPVFVAVTGNIYDAVLPVDFRSCRFLFPDYSYIRVLNISGTLSAISMLETDAHPVENVPQDYFGDQVRAYPTALKPLAYLPSDTRQDVVLLSDHVALPEVSAQKNWCDRLSVEGRQMENILYPSKSETTWKDELKHDFKSQVLSPNSAFIALENEQQKKELLNRQEKVLNGSKDFSLDEESQRMAEPATAWIVGTFALILLIQRYRRTIINFRF